MDTADPPDRPRFNATLVPPPYDGIVVVHSSRVARIGIEQLLEGHPGGVAVVASAATIAEAEDVLVDHRQIVAIVEGDIRAGGPLEVVARGVRGGSRFPVIALLDEAREPLVPYGFCQAAARMGGDSQALADAVSAVLRGGTYLGPDLLHRRTTLATPSDEPLTPREIQMLRRIAFGETSKEVAAAHMVSSETVKTHVTKAMRKLGASTRAHAVAIGYERGLLGPTPPLLIKSNIVWTRLAESMVYETFADAAADVLRYLYELCGFDTWLLTETLGGHCVSLESLGAVPPAVMKSNEDLCTLIDTTSGLVVIEDTRESACTPRERELFEQLGIRSYLAAPIAKGADGAVHASMCAFSSTPRDAPLDDAQRAGVTDAAELLSSMVPGSAR